MREKIIIDGVVYKRVEDEVKEYELYSEIKFKGLDWYVLKDKGEYVRLLLKNVLDEERIKKYCDDEWYRDGRCVAHSDIIRGPFHWKDSYIRNTILPNFKADLNMKGKITLLSKTEVENLPEEVRSCNDWYWTKTNASDPDDRCSYVFIVDSNGYVGNGSARSTFGVRPVIEILKSDIESV